MNIKELERLAGECTALPWMLATSCSWRRIVSERGDGVCVPTIQRADNHPDLHFPNGGSEGVDADYITAACNSLPALLELVKCQHEALEEIANPCNSNDLEAGPAIARAALAKYNDMMKGATDD